MAGRIHTYFVSGTEEYFGLNKLHQAGDVRHRVHGASLRWRCPGPSKWSKCFIIIYNFFYIFWIAVYSVTCTLYLNDIKYYLQLNNNLSNLSIRNKQILWFSIGLWWVEVWKYSSLCMFVIQRIITLFRVLLTYKHIFLHLLFKITE